MKVLLSMLVAACAASATPEARVSAVEFRPAPGWSRLYVYRPSRAMGVASSIVIFVDTQQVGWLDSGTFLMVEVLPGAHRLSVTGGESRQQLVVDALPDSCYFFKTWPKIGILGARAGIEPMDPAEGRRAVQAVRMVESTMPKPVS